MKKIIHYIPEIKGCYGPRLWINQEDTELASFIKLICLWGGPTDYSANHNQRFGLYELPLGTFENPLWQIAVSRLGVSLTQDPLEVHDDEV